MSEEKDLKTKEEKEDDFLNGSNVCSICGKSWEYKTVSGIENGIHWCLHDSEADNSCPTLGEDDKYRNHLTKREALVKRHKEGKLPKGYYSTRYDKARKKNVPYLSPKKLMSNKSTLR